MNTPRPWNPRQTQKVAIARQPYRGSCLNCFVAICFWAALLFSLPTPWGNLELDVFPPAIRLGDVAPVTSAVERD